MNRCARFGAASGRATGAALFLALASQGAFSADWSGWQPVPDRYKSAVDFRVQDSDDRSAARARVQFRNRYGQKVTVKFVIRGEDDQGETRQIESSASLEPGEQRLGKDAQSVALVKVSGVALAEITFSRDVPAPGAGGVPFKSDDTARWEKEREAAQERVRLAETDKIDAERALARVRASADTRTPYVYDQSRGAAVIMDKSDVGRGEMVVNAAANREEKARKDLETLDALLADARGGDRDINASRLRLTRLFAQAGEWAKAGDWLRVDSVMRSLLADKMLALTDSDRAVVSVNLGLALLHQNKAADAETAFGEACRLEPQNGAYRNELADALLTQEKFVPAEAALREAVRLSPAEASYRYNLGYVLERQNRQSDAEAAYREAVRLDGGNTRYAERLKAVVDARTAPPARE
jgi:tetratricopeptide (TPR) repeat protein